MIEYVAVNGELSDAFTDTFVILPDPCKKSADPSQPIIRSIQSVLADRLAISCISCAIVSLAIVPSNTTFKTPPIIYDPNFVYS